MFRYRSVFRVHTRPAGSGVLRVWHSSSRIHPTEENSISCSTFCGSALFFARHRSSLVLRCGVHSSLPRVSKGQNAEHEKLSRTPNSRAGRQSICSIVSHWAVGMRACTLRRNYKCGLRTAVSAAGSEYVAVSKVQRTPRQTERGKRNTKNSFKIRLSPSRSDGTRCGSEHFEVSTSCIRRLFVSVWNRE